MTDIDPEKITFKIKELVKATGLSKSTIYRLMDSGELPSFMFHGSRMVLRDDVVAMFEKARTSQNPPVQSGLVRAA